MAVIPDAKSWSAMMKRAELEAEAEKKVGRGYSIHGLSNFELMQIIDGEIIDVEYKEKENPND